MSKKSKKAKKSKVSQPKAKEQTSWLGKLWNESARLFKKTVSAIYDGTKYCLSKLWEGLSYLGSKLWDATKYAAAKVADFVVALAVGIYRFVVDVVKCAGKKIWEFIVGIWEAIKAGWHQGYDALFAKPKTATA